MSRPRDLFERQTGSRQDAFAMRITRESSTIRDIHRDTPSIRDPSVGAPRTARWWHQSTQAQSRPVCVQRDALRTPQRAYTSLKASEMKAAGISGCPQRRPPTRPVPAGSIEDVVTAHFTQLVVHAPANDVGEFTCNRFTSSAATSSGEMLRRPPRRSGLRPKPP